MNVLKDHDLAKLQARGFELGEANVRGQIDGMYADLLLEGALRIQVYQGCNGVYELQGRGRGRSKVRVLVGLEWFKPVWSIGNRENDKWTYLVRGKAETVDAALNDALLCFRSLFPAVALPAGVA